jgi:hypothetical protein
LRSNCTAAGAIYEDFRRILGHESHLFDLTVDDPVALTAAAALLAIVALAAATSRPAAPRVSIRCCPCGVNKVKKYETRRSPRPRYSYF